MDACCAATNSQKMIDFLVFVVLLWGLTFCGRSIVDPYWLLLLIPIWLRSLIWKWGKLLHISIFDTTISRDWDEWIKTNLGLQFITGKSWIFFDHFFLNVRPVKIGKISLISGVNNSPKNAWLETFLSSHTCVYEKRNGMRGFLHNSLSPLFTAKTLSHINIQVSLLYPKVTSQRNHYERHALTFNGKNVIVNYGIKRKRTEEKSQFESVKSVDRKSFSYSCFRN